MTDAVSRGRSRFQIRTSWMSGAFVGGKGSDAVRNYSDTFDDLGVGWAWWQWRQDRNWGIRNGDGDFINTDFLRRLARPSWPRPRKAFTQVQATVASGCFASPSTNGTTTSRSWWPGPWRW